MLSRRIVHAAALVALVALSAGCARKADQGATPPAGQAVIGLVFDVGGRGDKSFNDQAYAGLEHARDSLGITFQTLETGEGADREAAMRQLAPRGAADSSARLPVHETSQLAVGSPQSCMHDYRWIPRHPPPNLVAPSSARRQLVPGRALSAWSASPQVGFVGGMRAR